MDLSLFFTKRKFLAAGFSFLPSTNHFGAGNVAVFVDEIQKTGLFFDADFRDLFGFAAFFVSSGHDGAGNVAVLIDEIQVPLLFFYTNLRYFLSHVVTSFLSV